MVEITLTYGAARRTVTVNENGKTSVFDMNAIGREGRDKVRRLVVEWFRQQKEKK